MTVPTDSIEKTSPVSPRSFSVEQVREDFPILKRQVHGKPLAYLDNAATGQKPQCVIDAINDVYCRYNSNVHRGVHTLSEEATEAYEQARVRFAAYLGVAPGSDDQHDSPPVIFTRGTTEAINLVAQTYGRANLQAGDEVVITHMEHHSNIVPWQMICEQTGAQLRVAPIDDRGVLQLDAFEALLSEKTKIVAASHISNSLGTINPVKQMVEMAHKVGAVILLDGAQAAPHGRVNLCDLDCDFYALSAHKLFGPTGVGVLYGKPELLAAMPPYQGGGDMIHSVSFEQTLYADPPYRFEAGTPNIAGVIGMGAAVDYLSALDFDAAAKYEDDLLAYGTAALNEIPGVRLIGTAPEKAAVLSFVLEGIAPYDMSPVLDHAGVAIRTGHHCAQPVMEHFGVSATVRASMAFYNTRDEIDQLIAGLHDVKQIFGG